MMKEYGSEAKQPARLHARAEEFLNKNLSAIKKTPPRDLRDLFEDLRIYQTELENRNETLCIAQRELQQARDKYSVLYEFAPVGYFMINGEGLIMEANYTCASLLKEEKDTLIGKFFQHFIAKDDLVKFRTLCEKILSGRTRQSDELRLIAQDNTEIYGHLEGSIGQCNDGKPIQIRMVVTDISECRRAELERRNAQDRFQHFSKMKAMGSFAGGIANEFDNILASILGNTEMAMADLFNKDLVHESLAEAHAAALRARGLVKQILAFSHNSKLELKPVSITRLMGEAVKVIDSLSPKNIEVRHRFLQSSETIYADPMKIQQVLLNLCSNAFHAMGEAGGVLTICIEDLELDQASVIDYIDLHPGAYLRIMVSDTGCGVDRKIMDRIFDPYFSTKKRDECLGMGLAITHGIIKNHGGDVSFESEPGKGTVFHVLLPVIHDNVF